MCAIREGVAVTPFTLVEHLGPARQAGSRIGGDIGACFPANAARNGKAFECYDFVEMMDFDTFNA
jgi:hypothetical protein